VIVDVGERAQGYQSGRAALILRARTKNLSIQGRPRTTRREHRVGTGSEERRDWSRSPGTLREGERIVIRGASHLESGQKVARQQRAPPAPLKQAVQPRMTAFACRPTAFAGRLRPHPAGPEEKRISSSPRRHIIIHKIIASQRCHACDEVRTQAHFGSRTRARRPAPGNA